MHTKPIVTLSYAQSIDGSIATKRGTPLAISGDQSLRMTHQLRAENDAILVGVNTISADDPQLTVRLVEGENPQVIVLDSGLSISAEAQVVKNGAWIITTARAPLAQEKTLVAASAQVFRLRESRIGQIALPDLMQWLTRQGIKTLMVEGGGQIIDSFMRENLVDQVVITIAPIFVGGLQVMAQPIPLKRLHNISIDQLGDDVVIRGSL